MGFELNLRGILKSTDGIFRKLKKIKIDIEKQILIFVKVGRGHIIKNK